MKSSDSDLIKGIPTVPNDYKKSLMVVLIDEAEANSALSIELRMEINGVESGFEGQPSSAAYKTVDMSYLFDPAFARCFGNESHEF